eukprot:176734-Rhodomonas_salina.1
MSYQHTPTTISYQDHALSTRHLVPAFAFVSTAGFVPRAHALDGAYLHPRSRTRPGEAVFATVRACQKAVTFHCLHM